MVGSPSKPGGQAGVLKRPAAKQLGGQAGVLKRQAAKSLGGQAGVRKRPVQAGLTAGVRKRPGRLQRLGGGARQLDKGKFPKARNAFQLFYAFALAREKQHGRRMNAPKAAAEWKKMTTSQKTPYQQEAFNEKHGQVRAREQLGDNPRRTAFVKKAQAEGQAAEQAEGQAKTMLRLRVLQQSPLAILSRQA